MSKVHDEINELQHINTHTEDAAMILEHLALQSDYYFDYTDMDKYHKEQAEAIVAMIGTIARDLKATSKAMSEQISTVWKEVHA